MFFLKIKAIKVIWKNSMEDWFTAFYFSNKWNNYEIRLLIKIINFFLLFYLYYVLINLNLSDFFILEYNYNFFFKTPELKSVIIKKYLYVFYI